MTLFGKSLKSGKIWTNFEQYFLPRKIKNLENSLKKSAGICGKWKNLVKKCEKIWTNFEQPRKIKNW